MSSSERIEDLEKKHDTLTASCARMETMLEKICFHVVMETESIDHMLPINESATIESFMSNNDGRFLKRKRELEKLVFSAWSPQISKRQFSDNLINTLFTRSYIATHRWPHIG